MTKVINIVSPSGGGKTTIAKKLSEKYGYNVIQSYTTRPERYKDEYGHTFIQGQLSNCNNYIQTDDNRYYRDEMIAYFNSYDSGNHYFATGEQVLRDEINLYIVDPKGAEQVHGYFSGTGVQVITVFIQADELIRFDRLVYRSVDDCEIVSDEEAWNRIRPDRKIFESIKCDYTINGNKTLDKVTELVYDVISGE